MGLAVLEGASYRAAAKRAGLRSHRALHATVHALKLNEAHLLAWRASWGDEFPPVWRQHIEHISERA